MRGYASEYCTLYACTFLEYKRKRDKTKRAVRTSCLRTTSNVLALKQVRFHNEQDNRTAEVRCSFKNSSVFSRRHAHMLQVLNLYGCSRRNRQALEHVCCQLDKLELSYSSWVMEGLTWSLFTDRQRGAKKPTIQVAYSSGVGFFSVPLLHSLLFLSLLFLQSILLAFSNLSTIASFHPFLPSFPLILFIFSSPCFLSFTSTFLVSLQLSFINFSSHVNN